MDDHMGKMVLEELALFLGLAVDRLVGEDDIAERKRSAFGNRIVGIQVGETQNIRRLVHLPVFTVQNLNQIVIRQNDGRLKRARFNDARQLGHAQGYLHRLAGNGVDIQK